MNLRFPSRFHSVVLLVVLALVSPLALSLALTPAPQGPPQAGQIFEGFDSRTTEDPFAFRRDQRAIWARDSRLLASTHFTGSGGPGGTFDWTIQAGAPFVLDTTFAVIVNEDQTAQQTVLNGQVDVRNFTVDPGATLILVGPNPGRITASGTVRINGTIDVRGRNNPGVLVFNTGGPSHGAAGGPSGGRGGDASILATQSTPAGSPGFGAFNTPGGGGGGGETGFHPSTDLNQRRGAGGGGGRFANDVRVAATGCPDQSRIGLDVEQGGPGAPNANGAIGGLGVPPVPGAPGPSPFVDNDPTNDFWGLMRLGSGAHVTGELPHLWAGSGGGGGGDACMTSSFPTFPYNPTSDEIGSGGGGGGGALMILALSDIIFGASGRLDASGGTGGGGENTAGINRVGAGGAGGSGGHIVLQTRGALDFRACMGGINGARLWALGGQGGEGRDGVGGAGPNGVPRPPDQDSINLVPPFDPACLPTSPPGIINWVGTGGDGGPGVVQLHVGTLDDVLSPTAPGVTLSQIVSPPPVGADTVDTPPTWNQLVTSFGPLSSSRSKWYPIAFPSPPVDLRFAGTGPDGKVLTNGTGPNARVALLPPIASGTIQNGPNPPYLQPDGQTLVIDSASLTDDTWALDPELLENAELSMRNASGVRRFEIGNVLLGTQLSLTITEVGALYAYGPGDTFELRPRYFSVVTNSTPNWLPGSASIRITFQGAPSDGFGGADTSMASAWSPDINTLESVPGLAFLRFQVDFDMATDGSDLTLASPRPSLEFLKVVYRQ